MRKMRARGLAGLLAMPSALRPVLMQAALAPALSLAACISCSRRRLYLGTTASQPRTPHDDGPPRALSFIPSSPTLQPPRADLATDTSPTDLIRSASLFRSPKFLYSAPRFLHLPINTRIPEVCILGRSNVGKSTLINALAGLGGKKAGSSHGAKGNRTGIAVTSAKAGCTKTMNAYGFGPPLSVKPLTKAEQEARKVSGRARTERRGKGGAPTEPMPRHSVILMDMPGYGLNSRADWGEEILKYINRRVILHGAVLLIDAVAGVKDGDRMVLQVLRDAGLKTNIVLTKADKLVNDMDAAVWQDSAPLRQVSLHIWEEMRKVEKEGQMDWFEGDGWSPEIFVTGAGDPKLGGMGIDGARLAICRLAGHVAEPVRKVEAPQPEIVPFDQLVFSSPASTPKQESQLAGAVEEKVHGGRGRFTPPWRASQRAGPMEQSEAVEEIIRDGRGRSRPSWRASRRVDPMEQLEAAMKQSKAPRQYGQASF